MSKTILICPHCKKEIIIDKLWEELKNNWLKDIRRKKDGTNNN